MNWPEELCELYERNRDCAGKMMYKVYKTAKGEKRIPYVLLPPFHTTVAAQITVTVDEDGNFLEAAPVAADDKLTIIPVTEKSGSRTDIEPHPLCDYLRYVAGDYMDYMDKSAYKDAVCCQLFIEAMEKWHASPYSHRKVEAIYSYLQKKCMVYDLVQAKVLRLDENGLLDEKEKIQGISQSKAFVRFRVMLELSGMDGMDMTGEYAENCWEDRTLQKSFIEYYKSLAQEKGLCYLSGNLEQITYRHPKKIRNERDGAKLISANDTKDFTFRGHFLTKEQAFAVGSQTSQKMHNALKWIIRKQGGSHDTLMVVTWESALMPMPGWDMDTESICREYGAGADGWEDEEAGPELLPDTNAAGAEKLYAVLAGYGQRLEDMSRMVLMAFDAATTGRLALMEYKSLESARYLDNIKYWHTQCGWLHRRGGKSFTGMVGIRDIANILYGAESNGGLTILDKNRKRMYADICKRLIPCIWDRRNVPSDLVNLAIRKASYKERYNWEIVLTLACSFVKKYRCERKQEVWTLALDENCRDRNYLYGRLLAVADRVEYRTFDKENDKSRVTNAKRYMSAFSQRPYETWKTIEESLQPYFIKLNIGERLKYQKLLDEIGELFDIESFTDNSMLDGLYLLGFHSQSHALKKYTGDKAGEEEK